MTIHNVLASFGVISQLAGVVIAGCGLWKTWHEFAPEGASFLGPPKAWLRARLGRLWSRVVRLIRGRERESVIALAGSATAHADACGALSQTGVGPLPSRTSTKAAIAVLDDRTRQLIDRANDAERRLDVESQRARHDREGLEGRVSEAERHLGLKIVHVAVGGLRWEAAGLFCVALGVCFQELASLVG